MWLIIVYFGVVNTLRRLVLILVIIYNTMECYLLIGKCVYTIVWFHRVRWWEV